MNRGKILKISVVIFLIILLPVIVILANFRLIVFNEQFYDAELKKLESETRYPEAQTLAKEIISYYEKGGELPVDKLAEREISHLKDVKKIVNGTIYALYSAIFFYLLMVFLIFKITKKYSSFFNYLKKSIFAGSLILLIMLVFSSFIFLSFHSSFTNFHYLFFGKGTWTFPEESNLIRTFPEQFFIDAAFAIFLNSFITALALISISFMAIKIRTEKQHRVS